MIPLTQKLLPEGQLSQQKDSPGMPAPVPGRSSWSGWRQQSEGYQCQAIPVCLLHSIRNGLAADLDEPIGHRSSRSAKVIGHVDHDFKLAFHDGSRGYLEPTLPKLRTEDSPKIHPSASSEGGEVGPGCHDPSEQRAKTRLAPGISGDFWVSHSRPAWKKLDLRRSRSASLTSY